MEKLAGSLNSEMPWLKNVLIIENIDDIKNLTTSCSGGSHRKIPDAVLYQPSSKETQSVHLFVHVVRSVYDVQVPLILVTSEHVPQRIRTEFLDIGGDYLVPKEDYPIIPKMIRAYRGQRRSREGFEEIVEPFEGFKLNTRTKRFFVENKEVSLTAQEYMVLETLMKNTVGNPNSICENSEFLNTLGEPIAVNVVRVVITRLRKKIAPFGIKNIPNHSNGTRGYQLTDKQRN